MKFPRLDRLSVRTRLFLAIFAPSFLLLALAAFGAFVSDVLALRTTIERGAAIDAELLGHVSRTALGLDDPRAGEEVLKSLKSNPDILAAAIYRGANEFFAGYASHEHIVIPAQPRSGRFGRVLDTTMPIVSGDEQVGVLWLEVSLDRFYSRMGYYSVALLAALALLSGAAAALASFLGREFSKPLEQLADSARKISGEQDYSVRAPVSETPEIKALTQAFNHMLERIEKQNLALTERTVDLEKANTELSKTNKELEAFTYTVSHDLRTPLRAISSYSQLLREDLGSVISAEATDLIERVQKNALKMAQLIDELLAFSRLDAHPLEKTEVDLTEMVKQVWQDLVSQMPESPAKLFVSQLPHAFADPLLLRQVLANLLSNALKYSRTRSEPVVEFGAFEKEGECIYFAKDNGVGFNMLYAKKLFGIFQRLHRDEEFEGTGVGLAIVHRIITRHGGRIWTESEPDKGATFFFTLGKQAHGNSGSAGRG